MTISRILWWTTVIGLACTIIRVPIKVATGGFKPTTPIQEWWAGFMMSYAHCLGYIGIVVEVEYRNLSSDIPPALGACFGVAAFVATVVAVLWCLYISLAYWWKKSK